MYYIYKLVNKVNSKFYIGKTTKTLSKRLSWHIKASHKNSSDVCNSAIHSAIKKYGSENFDIEEIDSADTLEELNSKEKYWISYYRNLSSDMMYNIADGGEGGATCNDYTWYTDGTHDYYFSKYESVPEHLVRGRSQLHTDNTNTVWINNGKIQKHIKWAELNKYSDWKFGMLNRSDEWREKARKSITSEKARINSAIKLREFHSKHPHWTNKTSFKKGDTPSNKGRIAITDNNKNKYIDEKDLDYWIKLGWHRGFTMHKHK